MKIFRKYLALITAVSLFLQQVAPLYAMEINPEEEPLLSSNQKKKNLNNNNKVSDNDKNYQKGTFSVNPLNIENTSFSNNSIISAPIGVIDDFIRKMEKDSNSGIKLKFPYGSITKEDLEHRISVEPIYISETEAGRLTQESIPQSAGVIIEKVSDKDILEVVGRHNMHALLRELWGEGIVREGEELFWLEDAKEGKSFLYKIMKAERTKTQSLLDHLKECKKEKSKLKKLDIQRILISSLLINPMDAHGETFEVQNGVKEKRIWPGNAFTELGIPFFQTRAHLEGGVRPHYELGVFNILYIHEFERQGLEGETFVSDEDLLPEVKASFLSKSGKEVILNWLSWPPVRDMLIKGKRTHQGLVESSIIMHFQEMYEQVRKRLQQSEKISIKYLFEYCSSKILETYANVRTRFQDPILPEAVREVVLFNQLKNSPSRIIPSAKEDPLQIYQKYTFYNRLQGKEIYDEFLERIFLNAEVDDEKCPRTDDERRNYLKREILPWFQRIAADYVRMYPQGVGNNKNELMLTLPQGRREHFYQRLYELLSLPDVGIETLKFGTSLGFDINAKEDGLSFFRHLEQMKKDQKDLTNGLSLIHKAVLENDLIKINLLTTIPGIQVDILAKGGESDNVESPLDMAVRLKWKEGFLRLVNSNAGRGLQYPERLHNWYLELSKNDPDKLNQQLRDAFKSLADRHQKFRWFVVLEEVFPQRGQDVVVDSMNIEQMMDALGKHFIENERHRFTGDESEDYQTKKKRFEDRQNPLERKQERKLDLQKFLIDKANRVLNVIISAKNQFYLDAVTAAVNLNLWSEEHQENFRSTHQDQTQSIDLIEAQKERLIGSQNRDIYRKYKTSSDERYLADAMALTSIREKYKGRGVSSIPAFEALPRLVGYLESQLKQRFDPFWNDFKNNLPLEKYENDFLNLLRQSIDPDIQRKELELSLQDAYIRVLRPISLFRSAENGDRILSPDICLRFWKGNVFQRENLHGLCNVQKIGRDILRQQDSNIPQSLLGKAGILFIKQYPQAPGLEAAASKLLHTLIRGGAPYSDLFEKEGIPYLVSQGFGEGDLLERVSTSRPAVEADLKQLDPIKASQLIIATMVLSPEDGKLDNFVLCPFEGNPQRTQLVGIDNDHSFVDIVGNEKNRLLMKENRRIETQTCLFAIKSLMTSPIPIEVRTELLSLDVNSFFQRWLGSLQNLDKKYDQLFPNQTQRAGLVFSHNSYVTIPLTQRMVMGVYDRLKFIQEALTREENSIETHAELLGKVIPPLSRKSRYGKYWEDRLAPYGFLDDHEIRFITSSRMSSYITSLCLPQDARVDVSLHERPHRAESQLKNFREKIEKIEAALQNNAFTPATFEDFKASTYQQRLFLDKVNFSAQQEDRLIWSTEDQTRLLHTLMDPGNPPSWVKLVGCSALNDGCFIKTPEVSKDNSHDFDGHTRQFHLSNLRHLDVRECTNLTPKFLEHLFQIPKSQDQISAGQKLTYLDISGIKYSGDKIIIDLKKLKTLKMNGLQNGNPDPSKTFLKKIQLDAPLLEVFECDGMPTLKNLELCTRSEVNSHLRVISLRNMARLTDIRLDKILYQRDEKGKFITQSKEINGEIVQEKIRKFPNLHELSLVGTNVTLPVIRGFQPYTSIDDIKIAQQRICEYAEEDPQKVLDHMSMNSNRITGVIDFTRHTGHFLKNTIGGAIWDIWGIYKVISKLVRWKKSSIDEKAGVTAGPFSTVAVTSIVQLARGLTPELIAAGGSTSSFVAATGVGASVTALIWMGRAAYWEHQRINQEIELARHIQGLTIRAALNKLNSSEETKRESLNLSNRNLGDQGILGLVTPPDGSKKNLGELIKLNLGENKITDTGGNHLLEALHNSPNLRELSLEGNTISETILQEISTELKSRALKDAPQEAIQDDFVQSKINNLGNIKEEQLPIHYNESRYFGLSIDGGGMRGYIPALFLRSLQTHIRDNHGQDKAIYKYFDYIGGTSIGGILALGLAIPEPVILANIRNPDPMTPDMLVNFFTKKGPTIFGSPRSYTFGGKIFDAKHNAEPLEGLMRKYFGDRKLSEALTPIVITGVRVDGSRGLEPYMFDSHQAIKTSIGTDTSRGQYDFLVRDVARATSAAPTYFSPASIRDLSPQRNLYSFWDGGVWNNNPSQLVYNQIVETYKDKQRGGQSPNPSNVKILSLGTGEGQSQYSPISYSDAIRNISPLILGQMDLSQEGVTQQMISQLGSSYARVQPVLRKKNGGRLAATLDDTSKEVMDIYEEAATEIWVKHEEFVRNLVIASDNRKEEGNKSSKEEAKKN